MYNKKELIEFLKVLKSSKLLGKKFYNEEEKRMVAVNEKLTKWAENELKTIEA